MASRRSSTERRAAGRPATGRSTARTRAPAAGAALGRGRRRQRPPRLLRRHRAAQPRAGRVRRARSGASTRPAPRSTGAPACRACSTCPSPSTRSWSRSRPPASPRSSPTRSPRGCGGAIVFAAGFGEVEAGRGLEAELRELALGAGFPVCGPNGNGIVAVGGPGAALGRLGRRRSGPGGWRWSRRAATSPSTRSARGAGSTSTPWSRPATRPCSTPATGSRRSPRRDGVGSVAMFLESDGDGAKLAEALAICAERGVGVAVLKVGASAGGRARGRRAHRRRSPATSGSSARWSRRRARPGPRTRTSCSSSPGRWPSRGRGRAAGGGLAVLTCSGGDSGLAADEAQRLGLELPEFSPGDPRAARRAAARGGDGRQPARLHVADLGARPIACARIAATVGDDPAIDQLLLLLRPPARARRRARGGVGARCARRSPRARSSRAPRRMFAVHPPRPARRRGRPRARRTRRAGDRRAVDGAALRAWRCGARRRSARACARSRRDSTLAAADDREPTATAGSARREAKALLRAGGIAVPPGGAAVGRRGVRRARRARSATRSR